MCKDKQVIRTEDIGSLEELLGPNDPLFQPEPKQTKEWKCPRCGYSNSHKNEVCMASEMGDGRCGHPKVN